MAITNIDLKDYKSSDTRIYSGRNRGNTVRRSINLKIIEEAILKSEDTKVIITIPKDTFSLNTSFFLGLFGDTVRALGEEKFRKCFEFVTKPSILNNINEGIERALKEKSVL
jgi:hypothetical protein